MSHYQGGALTLSGFALSNYQTTSDMELSIAFEAGKEGRIVLACCLPLAV